MHIPRHPERGSLGRAHRSPIEAGERESDPREKVLTLNNFQQENEKPVGHAATHTGAGEAELHPVMKVLLILHAKTDPHSARCLPVIIYRTLWVLGKLLLMFCKYYECVFKL